MFSLECIILFGLGDFTMHYNAEYIAELEDLIMDELLPMYLIGCRASGVDPKMNKMLSRLTSARSLKQQVPALLIKGFDKEPHSLTKSR